MDAPRPPRPRRGLVAIDGAMALMAILLIVQMWLLTATLDGVLAGDRAAALPGAILSGVLAVACAALAIFVNGVDRRSHQPPRR